MLSQSLLTHKLTKSLAGLFESGHPFEVAVYAGLLSRHPEPDLQAQQALAAARALAAHGVLSGALPEAAVFEAAVDHLADFDDVDGADGVSPPAERLAALEALDALCAGSWFLGDTRLALRAVDLAADSIVTFCEPWEALAAHAGEVLGRVPPAKDDPARRLWRSVQWLAQGEPTERMPLPAGHRTLARVARIGGDVVLLVMAILALLVMRLSGWGLGLVLSGAYLLVLDHILCHLLGWPSAAALLTRGEGSHVQ